MGEKDEFGGLVAEDGGVDGSGSDEWVAGGFESVRPAPLRVVRPGVSEQRIRDDLGYASSETRVKAERDAAAQRIVSRLPAILAKIESER